MKEEAGMMGKTLLVVVVAAVCLSAGLAGGYLIGATIASNNTNNSQMTFVDDYDRNVTITGYPERIVSVAPTPTEMLFAVGAGDLVVGVDGYSDYPAATQNITKVGDYELNIEQIITLKPDLILSSDLVPQADLDMLESNGIPYMIIADSTIDDIFASIQLVGNVTNHKTDAANLVASLKARISAVTNITLAPGVSKPSVYIEYWPYWTFGPGSFGHDLIELAGGRNIAENETSEYPSVDDEFVVHENPDILVYTSGTYMTNNESEILSRPNWNTITAVEDMNVHSIDDNLISRYGPRIVDGLEQLAAIIHPELF
jgi:iron complex transport system substrate-binding protein